MINSIPLITRIAEGLDAAADISHPIRIGREIGVVLIKMLAPGVVVVAFDGEVGGIDQCPDCAERVFDVEALLGCTVFLKLPHQAGGAAEVVELDIVGVIELLYYRADVIIYVFYISLIIIYFLVSCSFYVHFIILL